MKHETNNYIIDFEPSKKRFTATSKASGESIVFRKPSVAMINTAMVKLASMPDSEIDAMCDCDFNR
jgi:hypothetical protein